MVNIQGLKPSMSQLLDEFFSSWFMLLANRLIVTVEGVRLDSSHLNDLSLVWLIVMYSICRDDNDKTKKHQGGYMAQSEQEQAIPTYNEYPVTISECSV